MLIVCFPMMGGGGFLPFGPNLRNNVSFMVTILIDSGADVTV